MRRALCFSMLLWAIGWAGPAGAASPGLHAARVHRGLIWLDVHIYSTLPSGSLVTCRAELEPEAESPGEEMRSDAWAAGAGGSAILAGSFRLCAVEVPVWWTGDRLPLAMTLRYEIDVETRPGMRFVVVQRRILQTYASSPVTVSLNLGPIP